MTPAVTRVLIEASATVLPGDIGAHSCSVAAGGKWCIIHVHKNSGRHSYSNRYAAARARRADRYRSGPPPDKQRGRGGGVCQLRKMTAIFLDVKIIYRMRVLFILVDRLHLCASTHDTKHVGQLRFGELIIQRFTAILGHGTKTKNLQKKQKKKQFLYRMASYANICET